ncbi:MAG: alkaline phosphatase family protein [Clostridia bacterium]|nr:alkaline phosphatase family protein [Clostridia bacterium]
MKPIRRLTLCLLMLTALLLGAALCACTPDSPPEETTGTVTESPAAPDSEALSDEPDETEPAVSEEVTEPATEETTAEPETEGPVPEGWVYQHVVIVGVDGAGAFFARADTPNLDRIFEKGAVTYRALTSTPTISAQCWGSMLHGVTAQIHGLTNGIVESTPYPADSPFPSVFRVIREQMPEAKLGSFCNWNPINVGIIEDGLGVYKSGSKPDATIINEACTYAKENQPTLLFIQLDEADGVGHSQGYNTTAQLNKIKEQDALIQKLYETYDELGILGDTLFIVTADHGGSGTGHGGLTDEEKYVMFAAAGRTVEKGEIQDIEVRDTPAVVLHALGLTAPTTWSARVPSGLFKGVTATERPVYVNPDSDRYHEPTPTPAKGSDGYITSFIDNPLKYYLPFDGDVSDVCGAATEEGGKLYFVDGYFGRGVELSDGYVAIPDYAPDKDSFSVSLWVNTQGVAGDPVLFSNKDWEKGVNQGYVLSLWGDEKKIRFNVGDGTNRMDDDHMLPDDYYEGWMHVLLVVDREEGMIRFSYDFGPMISSPIPASLKDDSFTALSKLCIGTDGTGAYKCKLAATVDEFMVFDGALSKDDLVKLAEYYGKEAQTESIRDRESVPTPEKDSAGYITNFITDKNLKTYLTFDGSAADACGIATVTEKGTVTYADGFFGQAAVLDKGYVSLADYHPAKDSFTVSMWVKSAGVASDPSLISNKDWGSGTNAGFIFSLRDSQDLKFNLGDGKGNRADKEFMLPNDYRAGWFHVTMVVDREAGVIKLSYDFGAFDSLTLPDNLKDISFDAFDVLNIGQDGTGKYSACAATVDEFMLFDGALTEADLAALAAYYGA